MLVFLVIAAVIGSAVLFIGCLLLRFRSNRRDGSELGEDEDGDLIAESFAFIRNRELASTPETSEIFMQNITRQSSVEMDARTLLERRTRNRNFLSRLKLQDSERKSPIKESDANRIKSPQSALEKSKGPPSPLEKSKGPPSPLEKSKGPPSPLEKSKGPPSPLEKSKGPPSPLKKREAPPTPVQKEPPARLEKSMRTPPSPPKEKPSLAQEVKPIVPPTPKEEPPAPPVHKAPLVPPRGSSRPSEPGQESEQPKPRTRKQIPEKTPELMGPILKIKASREQAKDRPKPAGQSSIKQKAQALLAQNLKMGLPGMRKVGHRRSPSDAVVETRTTDREQEKDEAGAEEKAKKVDKGPLLDSTVVRERLTLGKRSLVQRRPRSKPSARPLSSSADFWSDSTVPRPPRIQIPAPLSENEEEVEPEEGEKQQPTEDIESLNELLLKKLQKKAKKIKSTEEKAAEIPGTTEGKRKLKDPLRKLRTGRKDRENEQEEQVQGKASSPAEEQEEQSTEEKAAEIPGTTEGKRKLKDPLRKVRTGKQKPEEDIVKPKYKLIGK